MSLTIEIRKKLSSFTLEISLSTDSLYTGILGASGCGKSMTLKCIAGIETPDEGLIVINGKTLFDSKAGINIKPQERHAGYLFQNFALFPTMTVEENISIAVCETQKNRKKEIVQNIITRLELSGLEKSRPDKLSGGQQQRTALARMLASNPSIIMLDEPLSALDSFLRLQVEHELMNILSIFKGPVLHVSHSRNEVYRMCSRIVVLNKGKIDRQDNREEIFNNPQTVNTARLTGCKNIAQIHRTGKKEFYVPQWGLKLQTESVIPDHCTHAGIRSHHFYASLGENSINTFNFILEAHTASPFSITEYVLPVNPEYPPGGGIKRLVPLCREHPADQGTKETIAYTSEQKFIRLQIPPDKILLLKE